MRRDLKIDFIRGYAMFVMTVDHILVRRSLLYTLTGQGNFYLTAAEAFYFLSGLVLGMVASHHSLRQNVQRVLRRAVQLYAVSIAVSLLFTLLGVLTPLSLWFDVQTSLPRGPALTTFILDFFTLRSAFHGAEFLVLYVVLLLAAPLALWLLASGAGWLVLLLSFGVYALAQLFPAAVSLPVHTIFFPAAWQVLFFFGLLIGWRRLELSRLARRVWASRLGYPLGAALASLSLFFAWLHFTDFQAWPALPALLGSREQQLNPLRLGLAALYLLDIFLLVRWLWRPLKAAAGWLLLPLGQNSLWSFVAHLAAAVVVINLPFYIRNATRLEGAFFHLLGVSMVWGSIWLRDRLLAAVQKHAAGVGRGAATQA